MGARKLEPQTGEILSHPVGQLYQNLMDLIDARVSAQLASANLGGSSPTFAEYRARAGLTRDELALLSKCSVSTIGALERAEIANPDFGLLNKIAAALNVEQSSFRAHVVAERQRRGR